MTTNAPYGNETPDRATGNRPTEDSGMTRRHLLAAGAGSTLSGWAAADGGQTENAAGTRLENVYQSLGVTPVINAAGTITTMGGSLMPPEVTDAWLAASRQFVPLLELQDRVGERIAELLKVEAALVTTGAAGAIQVGTAAAMTWKHAERVSQLPRVPGPPLEIIRQVAHRECYDHQALACGARIVSVKTRADLNRAINERTTMMLGYNVHEPDGEIRHAEWLEVARQHGIVTLLDAAADVPPLERLWEYNHMGYDLVAFSGGKALRGPQDAGLLLGRAALIAAAKRNTAPHCNNIGRGLKVSKEDMVAMYAAVKRYVHLDHVAEQAEWLRRIQVISQAVAEIPTVRTNTVTPPIANHVPHLIVDWDRQRIPLTPAELKQRLASGKPPILTARVHGTGSAGFLLSVFMLQPGEEQVVGSRLAALLRAACM